jgi:hypothetical protein
MNARDDREHSQSTGSPIDANLDSPVKMSQIEKSVIPINAETHGPA